MSKSTTIRAAALSVALVGMAIAGASQSNAAGINKLLVSSSSRLDMVALNPQPLPPKEAGASRFDAVALNPQPLPPKTGNSLSSRAIIVVGGKY